MSPNASAQTFRAELWFAHHGDSTLRLDYDLNPNSIVFDLGGYEGNWTDEMFRRFSCNIHVFEPVGRFADNMESRFAGNPKVEVHRFGLGGQTKKCLLAILADGSSVFREGAEKEEVLLVEATEFFKASGITDIDLMKINIEGSEYELLEHLIQTGFISRIDNIQVQFHDVVPQAFERMEQIQQALRNTHYITYQCEFIWENWRRRVVPDTVSECQRVIRQLHRLIEYSTKEALLYQRDIVSAKADIEGLKSKLEETQNQLVTMRNSLEIAQSRLLNPKSSFFRAREILGKRLQKWTKPR